MGHSLLHQTQLALQRTAIDNDIKAQNVILTQLNELGVSTNITLLSGASEAGQQADKLQQLRTILSNFLAKPPTVPEIIIQEEPISDIIFSEPIVSDIQPIGVIEIPQTEQNNTLRNTLLIGGALLLLL